MSTSSKKRQGHGCYDEVDVKDPRHKKWKKQRRTRGFDDTELWNLDVTFARFMLPRLKAFKEIDNGHPGNLTEKKWDSILDEIIAALEFMDSSEYIHGDKTQVERGMKLFAKWHQSMWW